MRTIKKIICAFAIVSVVFTAGCSEKGDSTDVKYETSEPSATAVVESSLKSLMGNNFKDVEFFGDRIDTNVTGNVFYNAIFKNMEYKILDTTENGDGIYSVEIEIKNLDLSELPTVEDLKNSEEYRMFSDYELQTLIINTIAEMDKTVTRTVEAVLVKGEKGYNITNKSELYKVASGGYIGK